MGAWYNSAWKYRYPVAVECATGGGGTFAGDIEIVIPSIWPAFWDNIRSTGQDILVTDPNGNLLVLKRASFNYSNKTLTVAIQNHTMIDYDPSSINMIWLYWGNPTGNIAETTFTPSSPKSGQIFLGRPANMVVGPTTFVGTSANPISSFVKNEKTWGYVWFATNNLMSKRFSKANGKNVFEGIKYVGVEVLNGSGTVQSSMIDANKTRFIPGFVGVYIKAGSNNTNYQVRLKIGTTEEQLIALTCLLQVRNQLPSA